MVERIPPSAPEPKAREEAAKLVGSNPRYIQDAKAVKAADPRSHRGQGGSGGTSTSVSTGRMTRTEPMTIADAARYADIIDRSKRLRDEARSLIRESRLNRAASGRLLAEVRDWLKPLPGTFPDRQE
jgi:hypothetical protein